MALPDPVHRALPEGTEVLDATATGAKHPLGVLDDQVLATIHVVVTPTQVWLVAADGVHPPWCVASGAEDALLVDRGWVTDTYVAVGRRLSVPPTRRRTAARLAAVWASAPRGGPTVDAPAPPEDPEGRAPVAQGADVPNLLAEHVPADPDTRWLLALETAVVHHVPTPTGRPEGVPIQVLVSDRAVLLAAVAPDGRCAWRPLQGPLRVRRHRARQHLQGDAVDLPLPVLRGGDPDVVAKLVAQGQEERWATVAQHHLDRRRVGRAAAVWAEAVRLGRGDASWEAIAATTWAAGDARLAHRALVEGIRRGRLTEDDVERWRDQAGRIHRALGKPVEAADELVAGLGPTLDALDVPDVPEPLPRPPADAVELWVGALAATGWHEAARAAVHDLAAGPRAVEVRAALDEVAGATDPDAWRRAARGWAATGDLAGARRCQDRVLAHDPTPADLWQAATWAWDDQAREAARGLWQRALALDAAGASLPRMADPEAWRALGALAQGHDAVHLAARAWREVHTARPDDVEAAWTLATVLEEGLADTMGAAVVLSVVASRLEDGGGTGRRPSEAWLRVAALREGDDRVLALRNAVASDFLHPEAWEGVLAHADDLPDELAAWWRHLARVVGGAGGPDAPPPPTRSWLGAREQDALHPGGVGWLQALRQGLEGSVVPDRDTLVRGLETLADGWPEAQAVVEDLCAALQTPVPDAFLYRGDGAWGVSAWPTDPPLLLVGILHRDDPDRRLAPAGLRFAIATELAHLAAGHPLLDVDTTLSATGTSVYRAFGRYASAAENVAELLMMVPGVDQAARIERLVRTSRRVLATRHVLDRASDLAFTWLPDLADRDATERGLGREGLQGTALQNRHHAERIALVLTGDLAAAVDALLRTSTTAAALADRAAEEGVAALLTDPEAGLSADQTVRLSGLVAFAAVSGPFGTRAPAGPEGAPRS